MALEAAPWNAPSGLQKTEGPAIPHPSPSLTWESDMGSVRSMMSVSRLKRFRMRPAWERGEREGGGEVWER